jgi:hypothetical protein
MEDTRKKLNTNLLNEAGDVYKKNFVNQLHKMDKDKIARNITAFIPRLIKISRIDQTSFVH